VMARRRPRALGTIALTVAFGAAACGTATAESGVHGGETRDAAESPGLDGSVGDVGSTDASDRTANDGGPGASQSDEDSDGAAACPLTEVFLPPCNTIVPSGPLAATVCSLSEPPQPQGGLWPTERTSSSRRPCTEHVRRGARRKPLWSSAGGYGISEKWPSRPRPADRSR
jgi:hypothetical protein